MALIILFPTHLRETPDQTWARLDRHNVNPRRLVEWQQRTGKDVPSDTDIEMEGLSHTLEEIARIAKIEQQLIERGRM